MNVIATGMSGLVGSRISQLLSSDFTFQNISKETGFDITDKISMQDVFGSSDAPWIFHFAAFTDVEKAETEKELGDKSISWKVNVEATESIVSMAKTLGKKLLYISTDFVFDGKKEWYRECDAPNPISWYGRTKYEGEERVKTLGEQGLIIRIANPYRAFPVGKVDFVHKMRDRLQKGEVVSAPDNQWFSPTFIDDLAFSIKYLILKKASGMYHVAAKEGIRPYDAASVIAEIYGFSKDLVRSVSYEDFFKDRAKPPKQAILKHDKIDTFLSLHSFYEGVMKVYKEELGGNTI